MFKRKNWGLWKLRTQTRTSVDMRVCRTLTKQLPRIQSHSNIYFQYNGSVYPYHIFLNCKTKLQTILISATRNEFEIGIIFWTKIWTQPKVLVVFSSEFLNLTSRVHFYTQFDNQVDIFNDIVANGINPDSSSWDLRKTFELMKDPREDAKWINLWFFWLNSWFILGKLILMSDKTTGVSHASKIESTKVCACPLNKQFF